MAEVAADILLQTRTLAVRDVRCRGTCRHASPEECASATELVFPYRGVYTRHVGRDQAVAEAGQVLFFNADEGYRIAHPVSGGDACLSFALGPELLLELAPQPLLRRAGRPAFDGQRRGIAPRVHALAARLRQGLRAGTLEPLAAEDMALTLVRQALGERTSRAPAGTAGRRRLVDRAKLVLAADPARRRTLAEIAAETGGSPVYLTQSFQAVEGAPLYRHQLRLRLAQAIDRLHDAPDLTALALDLGFSSHSHFTAAFRTTYGQPLSAFRARRQPVRAR